MNDANQRNQFMAGRAALVTEASRGIGPAIAERLVDNGVRVAITGRDATTVEAAVAELVGPGAAIGIPGNISNSSHREAAGSATLEAFGRLDFLVNNTGINPAHGPLANLDLDIARKTVDTNVVATLWPDDSPTLGANPKTNSS